ncbi:MAG: hypothetical protein L6406_14990 [Desulfobacterales bacterium]|nr:hypothetical protein [Pseudomonadota bacterium]MCG2776975.1 hypothetical protein [Desulfobacterales bacterium]
MNPDLSKEIQKILDTTFGGFYFEAKLEKTPKPEDLMAPVSGVTGKSEMLLPGLGTISDFISWFKKEHGQNEDLRFQKLIKKLKKLSNSNEGIVHIADSLLCLRDNLKSEIHRKGYYKQVYKAEMKKHERAKKKEDQEYDKAISTLKKIPGILNEEFLKEFDKNNVSKIEPSQTLLQLQWMHKYGIIATFPRGRKSTKGWDSIKLFINHVYYIASKHSNLSQNAIYVEIAELLNLLEIREMTFTTYTRKNVKGIHQRYLQAQNPSE